MPASRTVLNRLEHLFGREKCTARPKTWAERRWLLLVFRGAWEAVRRNFHGSSVAATVAQAPCRLPGSCAEVGSSFRGSAKKAFGEMTDACRFAAFSALVRGYA